MSIMVVIGDCLMLILIAMVGGRRAAAKVSLSVNGNVRLSVPANHPASLIASSSLLAHPQTQKQLDHDHDHGLRRKASGGLLPLGTVHNAIARRDDIACHCHCPYPGSRLEEVAANSRQQLHPISPANDNGATTPPTHPHSSPHS
jgi:hypothetical protein